MAQDESLPCMHGRVREFKEAVQATTRVGDCPLPPPECSFIGKFYDQHNHCWCVYDCPEGTWYIPCP